jgi:hypothetical protein
VRRLALGQGLWTLAISQNKALTCGYGGALEGIRTPNLLIRSQMLYPLSYERSQCSILYRGRSWYVRLRRLCTSTASIERLIFRS